MDIPWHTIAPADSLSEFRLVWAGLLLASYVTGIIFMFQSMLEAYFWLSSADNPSLVGGGRGHKSQKRLEYIDSLSEEGKEVVYSEIWDPTKPEDIGHLVDKKGLALKFLDHIEVLRDKKSAGANILRKFTHYLSSVGGGVFLEDTEIYDKMFAFTAKWGLATESDPDLDPAPLEFIIVAQDLFGEIVNLSLGVDQSLPDPVRRFRAKLFFGASERLINDSPELDRHALMSEIAALIFHRLEGVANRSNPIRVGALSELPDAWRVNLANLNQPGGLAIVWLDAYTGWALELLHGGSWGGYRRTFDQVTRRVVNGVDRVLWANLLAFSLGAIHVKESDSSAVENKVRSFIEFTEIPHATRSSHSGLVDPTDTDKSEREHRKQLANERDEVLAINRATDTFPDLKDKDKLDDFIEVAKSTTEYGDDTKEKLRRDDLINFLELVRASM